MDITNYRYKDFLKLDMDVIEEYTSILFTVEPLPLKKEVQECTLDQVEQIRHNLFVDDMIPTVIGFVEEIDEKLVMEMPIIELFGKLIKIKDEIEFINDLETKYLTPEHPNMKWEAVNGGEKVSRFGIIPMVDGLAGGDITKWDAILNMPYYKVFQKLSYDTVMGDLEHRMSKIKTTKNNV